MGGRVAIQPKHHHRNHTWGAGERGEATLAAREAPGARLAGTKPAQAAPATAGKLRPLRRSPDTPSGAFAM